MAKQRENILRRRHASFADSEYQIEKRRTYYTRPDTPFRYGKCACCGLDCSRARERSASGEISAHR